MLLRACVRPAAFAAPAEPAAWPCPHRARRAVSQHAGGQRVRWETLLQQLAARGDVVRVRAELAAGADPNQAGWRGVTALHAAAHQGSVEAANALIEAGAQLDATDDAGSTPLHVAALGGHTELVKRLITLKAPLDALNVARMAPLHCAARRSQRRCAGAALRRCPALLPAYRAGVAALGHIHGAFALNARRFRSQGGSRGQRLNFLHAHLAVIEDRSRRDSAYPAACGDQLPRAAGRPDGRMHAREATGDLSRCC